MGALQRRQLPGDAVRKLDIDVCDAAGHVCVQLRGFSARSVDGAAGVRGVEEAADAVRTGAVLLTPTWEATARQPAEIWPSVDERVVIVGGAPMRRSLLRGQYPAAEMLELASEASVEAICERLEGRPVIDHVVWIAPEEVAAPIDDGIIRGQQQGVLQCFRLIKALLELGYGSKSLGWTILTTESQAITPDDAASPIHASVHGLIGSMAKEYPNWKIRLVDLPAGEDLAVIRTAEPAEGRARQWLGIS